MHEASRLSMKSCAYPGLVPMEDASPRCVPRNTLQGVSGSMINSPIDGVWPTVVGYSTEEVVPLVNRLEGTETVLEVVSPGSF